MNVAELWERLLEARIKLQKCLKASNTLPHADAFGELKSKCGVDDENKVDLLQDTLHHLLQNCIYLQALSRKRSAEYIKTKNSNNYELEPKNDDNNLESTNEDEYQPQRKRKKLSEYSAILEQQHNDYIPFRNCVIEKWYDKTRVSTGKLAKSNFSAFDQPILKQIELILSDKQRLIKRTQIKHSDCTIIGCESASEKKVKTESNNTDKASLEDEYNPEIFDDDHFYHQLLRNYIQRKTLGITDPTQLGKKWAELQKLRTKMKRKIDTRSTKGRQLRYNIHPKLVNFMAPISNNLWSDTAITELCSSLFGKK